MEFEIDLEKVEGIHQQKKKQAISSTPTIGFYSVSTPVIISIDSTRSSIQADIGYATRLLTKMEQNQPQIVKEALTVKFGCKKSHCYIYRKPITIETEHRPLETIFIETLCVPPSDSFH